jgi:NAD(P)-dependent dehydrogenase (short-subunit alcohol dehydrogenase family)
MRKSNYDKFPFVSVPNSADACVSGWDAIGAKLRQAITKRAARKTVVVIECYTGVREDELLRELQSRLEPALALRANAAMLPPDKIDGLVAPVPQFKCEDVGSRADFLDHGVGPAAMNRSRGDQEVIVFPGREPVGVFLRREKRAAGLRGFQVARHRHRLRIFTQAQIHARSRPDVKNVVTFVLRVTHPEMFPDKGPIFAVQKLAPLINRGGAIVFTTSIANVKGMPGNAAYSGAKAALRSFARILATELLPREIRVNAVSPGPIDTPIIGKMFSDKDAAAQLREKMAAMTPMKRFGTSEEIAKAVLFLAFDATFTTGAEIPVDGGWSQL